MSAIRKAAKWEECTLNIAGVCSYDPETAVKTKNFICAEAKHEPCCGLLNAVL